jgi:hypothetical protein
MFRGGLACRWRQDSSDSAEEMGSNRKVFAAMAMKRNGAAALELARLSV